MKFWVSLFAAILLNVMAWSVGWGQDPIERTATWGRGVGGGDPTEYVLCGNLEKANWETGECFTVPANATDMSYDFSIAVEYNQTWYFAVIAKNQFGQSGWTVSVDEIDTGPTPLPPTDPTNLRIIMKLSKNDKGEWEVKYAMVQNYPPNWWWPPSRR